MSKKIKMLVLATTVALGTTNVVPAFSHQKIKVKKSENKKIVTDFNANNYPNSIDINSMFYGTVGSININPKNNLLNYSSIQNTPLYYNYGNQEVLQISLLNDKFQFKNTFILNGADNTVNLKDINDWKYANGDIIELSSSLLNNFVSVMSGNSISSTINIPGYSSNLQSLYLRITPNGLVQIKSPMKVESLGDISLNVPECKNALSISFNNNHEITANAKNNIKIGANNNDIIEIKIYDKEKNLLKSFTAKGDELAQVLANQVNGTIFEPGDTISVKYIPDMNNLSSSNIGIDYSKNNKQIQTNLISNFEISDTGLVKIQDKINLKNIEVQNSLNDYRTILTTNQINNELSVKLNKKYPNYNGNLEVKLGALNKSFLSSSNPTIPVSVYMKGSKNPLLVSMDFDITGLIKTSNGIVYANKGKIVQNGFFEVNKLNHNLVLSNCENTSSFDLSNNSNYAVFNAQNGIISQNIFTDNGIKYIANDNGELQNSNWYNYKNNKYYANEFGEMLTGINDIDGKKYYFGPDGKYIEYSSIINLKNITENIGNIVLDKNSNKLIYQPKSSYNQFAWQLGLGLGIQISLLDSNYKVINSIQVNGNQETNIFNEINKWNYKYGDILAITQQQGNSFANIINENGMNASFDIPINIGENVANYMMITPTGLVSTNDGFIYQNGKRIYVDKNGKKNVGLKNIKGHEYCFNENGEMIKNKFININQEGMVTNDAANGTTVNTYYFDYLGQAVTGYQLLDNKKCLFANDGKLISDDDRVSINFLGSGINGNQNVFSLNVNQFSGQIELWKNECSFNINQNENIENNFTIDILDKDGNKVKSINASTSQTYKELYKLINSEFNGVKLSAGETVHITTHNNSINEKCMINYMNYDFWNKLYSPSIMNNPDITYNPTNKQTNPYNIKLYDYNRGGTPTLNISFNPNGTIYASGIHTWVGTEGNSYIDIKIYSKYKNLIGEFYGTGTDFASNFAPQINGTNFNYGDIISINYVNDNAQNNASIVYENNGERTNLTNQEIFKITPNGLEKFETPNVNISFTTDAKNGFSTVIPKVKYNEAQYLRYKSTFNPMEGIQILNNKNNQFKIQCKGNVDTSKPGIYKLEYTVTNPTACAINYNNFTDEAIGNLDFSSPQISFTRTIVVGAEKSVSGIGNYVNSYFSKDGSLVLEGDINSNVDFKKSTNMKVILKNANGNTIGAAYATPVNWYSSNKNNYNGYQSILNPYTLSMIKKNTDATLYLEVEEDGKEIEMPIFGNGNIQNSKLRYKVGENNNNQITVSSEKLELPKIKGIEDISVPYGSKVDLMKGVTLSSVYNDIKVIPTGSVDSSKPGKYEIVYKITDVYGEIENINRVITVLPAIPVIKGVKDQSIIVGEKFDPLSGISITDSDDNSAKINVTGNVDTSKPGKYEITYTVTDKYNQTSVAKNIITVLPSKPSIIGIKNETIEYGSKFNPMAGVKLIDLDDKLAKINVSGVVNTEKPGKYDLIYSVVDKYGQKVLETRTITVSNNFTSNYVNSYFSKDGSLVLEGDINSNVDFKKSTNMKVILKNANGNIIGAAYATPVNWYSSNKNNYNGYQSILNPYTLSMIKKNTDATLYLEVEQDGKEIEMPIFGSGNIQNSKLRYKVGENNNNQITIVSNSLDNTVKNNV